MPATESRPKLSLVVPVFQAIHCVRETLQQLDEWVKSQSIPVEIILVDDGCTDGSGAVLYSYAVERPAVQLVVHNKNKGKGRAVADGVAVAQGDLIAFTDVDLPYELSVLADVVQRAELFPQIHFFVGSRQHEESQLVRPYTLGRRIGSWIFNKAAHPLAPGATDMQCGFKCFRCDVARLLFSNLKVARYAFDVELFWRAHQFGLHFQELPVIFRHTPRSTIKWWSAIPNMFGDLARLYVARRKKI